MVARKWYGTAGSDKFTGSGRDDLFIMPYGGYDYVDGGGGYGYNVLEAQFSDAPGSSFRNGYTLVNTIYGTMSSDDVSYHLGFRLIDQLVYTGGVADEDTSIQNYSADYALNFILDAGAGVDALSLRYYKTGSFSFSVAEDGTASCSIGTFKNYESFHVEFVDGDNVGSGGVGTDFIAGGNGKDTLSGGAGNDQLLGDGGDDLIAGGLGADQLTGGTGADVFKWTQVDESRPKERDIILDFSHADNDRIDLSDVDAMAGRGTAHFTFINQAAFTGAGGTAFELRQQVNDDGTVTLFGDTNHDGKANFAIVIHTDQPLVAADLIL